MIEFIFPITIMVIGLIVCWMLQLYMWIPSIIILPAGWLVFVFWQKMWPVGLLCFEKRANSWILGKLSTTGARRIKKKDGTYNYQLRPYKTKITPPPFENLITDRKGKTWLVAFSPNANSFRAGIPVEVEDETVSNLAINETSVKRGFLGLGKSNKIINPTNGGIHIGSMDLPKVSFDTADQHDIKDFMEDWREKRERMTTGGFWQKWGMHIMFLIQAMFIFILLVMMIQGMPEMTNIWRQTAEVTKQATENLMKAVSNMQGGGLVPGGNGEPPW